MADRRIASQPPSMTEILAQIVRDQPADGAENGEIDAMADEDRKAAFLSIAQDILQEPEAPFRPEAMLFQDFGVRCRIARIGGPPLPLGEFRLYLNAARAGVDLGVVDTLQWERAIGFARSIPEDLQAVFLILAGAALQGLPCPSDADVAARCGQHSPGRARSRIRHLEKSDLVVIRPGVAGARAAVLPDFGWETAWGDANASANRPSAVSRLAAE
jgi:hypothetical protein